MPIIDAPPETPLVIDTDVFSHLRNRREYVQENIRNHFSNTKQFPAITAITVFEATQGVESELHKNKISSEQADIFRKRIDELIQNHQVLPLNQRASEIAAFIFPRLSKSARNLHWRDMFIISIALAHNFGLATQNKRDAELIGNLLPNNMFLRLAVWKPN
jgi:predicted nucleic acid-binding protein